MKKLFIGIIFFSFSSLIFANNAFISGDESYFYHSGPSTKYRIKGKVKQDESVEIIDSTSSNSFYKVQLSDNSSGWIKRQYVTQGANRESQIETLRDDLADSVALIKKQADEIHRLKMQVSTQKMHNDQNSNKQSQLTDRIYQLNHQINQLDDSNLIRWVTHLSTILLLACIFLYFVGTRKKRGKYM